MGFPLSHRRRQRRFCFPQDLTEKEAAFLLGALGAPRWMAARLARAATPEQLAALLHPARWPGRQGRLLSD